MARTHGHAGSHGGLIGAIWHSVKAGLPAALFLTSVLTVVSALHWLDPFEPTAMRAIYRLEDRGPAWLGLQMVNREYGRVPGDRLVSVLQMTELAFERDFKRMSPTPRGCLGEAFVRLARRLEKQRLPGGFPVVAVDIDITLDRRELWDGDAPPTWPAVLPAPCHETPQQVVWGLKALAQQATVIALALERRTPAERAGRNAFMRALCTDSKAFAPGRGGVHFASAAAFSRGIEPVMLSPARRWWDARAARLDDSMLPGVYPSLGNLLAIARRVHDRAAVTAEEIEALTAQCDDLRSRTETQLHEYRVMDDLVFADVYGDGAHRVAQRYEFKHLNLLRAMVEVQSFALDSIGELDTVTLKSANLLLALSDGSTADQFLTPKDTQHLSPGSWLQGATALTLHDPLHQSSKLVKALADLVAGALFAALVTPVHALKGARRPRWPFIQRAGLLLIPLFAALAVLAVGAVVSANLLQHGIWFNPLYMAVGMLLHTYYEASTAPVFSAGQGTRPAPSAGWLDRATTAISDLTDVDAAPAPQQRAPADVVAWGVWAAAYVIVLLVGLVVIVRSLSSAA